MSVRAPRRLPSATAVAALATLATISTFAVADDRAADRTGTTNRLALVLGGEQYGLVKLTESPERAPPGAHHFIVTAEDIAPSLVALVGAFAQGKPVKRDLRLSSGAVLRKASDARLASVKLPALGAGGTPDVELGFTTPTFATQPLLSAKEPPPLPRSARIASFRVDITGMSAIEAPKLDAITLTQRGDGNVTTGDIALYAAAGGAPPFTAWHKTGGGRPAARAVRIEYVGSDGVAIIKLALDRCTPTSVKPLGASGTTRVTLSCASVRPG